LPSITCSGAWFGSGAGISGAGGAFHNGFVCSSARRLFLPNRFRSRPRGSRRSRRRITADTALRLSLYFGNSPEFWMNLQTHYDVKMARRKLKPQDAKRKRARRAA